MIKTKQRLSCAGFLLLLFPLMVLNAADLPEQNIIEELHRLVRLCSDGEEEYHEQSDKIIISYDAFVYHIHTSNRLGRIQTWHEELGPNTKGIVIEVYILEQSYMGPLVLPQKLTGPYYDTFVNQIKSGDVYFYFQVSFGNDFPEDIKNKVLKIIGML